MKLALRLTFMIALLAVSYTSLPAATVFVKFQYTQSLIFVRVKVNNKGGLLFLMDTGANTSVIDKLTADKLKIHSLAKDSVLGTAGKEAIGLMKVKWIEVGNATARNMQMSLRDLSHFAALNGRKIDGILGMDFLHNYAITIDFRTKKMIFSKKPSKPGKQLSIPFTYNENLPVIAVRLHDTLNTHLRYNSGVSVERCKDVYLNLSPTQWRDLKGIDRRLLPDHYLSGKGVGGGVYLEVIRIKSIELNGLFIERPFIILQPSEGYFEQEGAIGFFGNNLLEKYYKVTLDFISQQIIINTVMHSDKGRAQLHHGRTFKLSHDGKV